MIDQFHGATRPPGANRNWGPPFDAFCGCAAGDFFGFTSADHLLHDGFMPNVGGEWRIFLAEAPHQPVIAFMDEPIYAALVGGDRNAWKALLEYIAQYHAAP